MLTDEQMREKFEAWVEKRYGFAPKRMGDGYKDSAMDEEWIAWRAGYAAALAAREPFRWYYAERDECGAETFYKLCADEAEARVHAERFGGTYFPVYAHPAPARSQDERKGEA